MKLNIRAKNRFLATTTDSILSRLCRPLCRYPIGAELAILVLELSSSIAVTCFSGYLLEPISECKTANDHMA